MRRRLWGILWPIWLACLIGILHSIPGRMAHGGQPPNIVLIVADDLGYGELGCYGQTQIQTPHIDRMAAEGMRFTDFYAGCTVCAPSRSVMMTGQHMGHTWVRGNARDDLRHQSLRDEDVTIAEVLKSGGYRTGICGKWGLGEFMGTDRSCPGIPNRQGFDFFFGYLSQHHAHNYYPEFLWRNLDQVPLKNRVIASRYQHPQWPFRAGHSGNRAEYSHDLIMQEATKFIRRNNRGPFLLYLPVTIPHANNEGTRATGNGLEIPSLGIYKDKDWSPQNKSQAAMITYLDRGVGEILALLKSLKIDDNTIVIFTSDNGHHNEGAHCPEFFDANGPLRGAKRDLYEGGIRVPMIVRWPGKVAAGVTTDHVSYSGDLMATLGEIAEQKLPAKIDSVSFAPTLSGQEQLQQHEYLYWEFYEQGSAQAARIGDWKAVRRPMLSGPVEVYDLKNDVGETTDLAAQQPDLVARFERLFSEAHRPHPNWSPVGTRQESSADRKYDRRALTFTKIEAREFLMGANPGPDVFKKGRADRYEGPDWDEGPVHRVKLTRSFSFGNRQISAAEFLLFLPSYKERVRSRGEIWHPDGPAVLVSWNEARAYCRWRSQKDNAHYRLPTEAEWELAARNRTAFQIEDVADGVQEWCADWWAPYPSDYENRVAVDPGGPETGMVRIVRDGGGGSLEDRRKNTGDAHLNRQRTRAPIDFRVTDRSGTVADDRRRNLGFRMVSVDNPAVVEQVAGKPSTDTDGSLKHMALQGEPFQNVQLQALQWEQPKDSDAPVFWGGVEFMAQPSAAATLPYWGRHHVPSLTYCDNGDLLLTSFTAAFDNNDQMAILLTRLRRGKKKWDAPALFFVAPDRNVTSATLYNDSRGNLHHYNGLGSNLCEDFSMVKRASSDNGATWSAPRMVHDYPTRPATKQDPAGEPRLWPHMDLKRTPQGALLMSTDVGGGDDPGSALFISRDNGESWEQRSRYPWQRENFAIAGKTAGWIAGIHAPVVTLNNGDLLAFGRSNNIRGKAPMSRSLDGGKTWHFEASPFAPIHSSQRPVLMRLNEGPLLLISYTDSSARAAEKSIQGMEFRTMSGGTRNGVGLFAAVSLDGGKTWRYKKLIPNWWKNSPWKSRLYGYLSCVQTPDRRIHLVSSSHYYCFNLAWLQEPMAD